MTVEQLEKWLQKCRDEEKRSGSPLTDESLELMTFVARYIDEKKNQTVCS